MSKNTAKVEKEREEFRLKLQEHILTSKARVLYTSLRHVSSSGMSRKIDVITLTPTGHPADPISIVGLSYWAAEALGWGFCTKSGTVIVKGCGMDMGFHLVYALSSIIFRGVPRDQWPADLPLRNGEVENDPGYVLRHRWV